jgi:hypothetical protein
MPHTHFDLFGVAPDLIGLDPVEPRHSQAIGLVVADRDPPSPIAAAPLKSFRQPKLENCLDVGCVSH